MGFTCILKTNIVLDECYWDFKLCYGVIKNVISIIDTFIKISTKIHNVKRCIKNENIR